MGQTFMKVYSNIFKSDVTYSIQRAKKREALCPVVLVPLIKLAFTKLSSSFFTVTKMLLLSVLQIYEVIQTKNNSKLREKKSGLSHKRINRLKRKIIKLNDNKLCAFYSLVIK